MADQMTLNPAALRNLADVLVRYCHVQNALLDQYLSDIYGLSDEWRDDETFSLMVEAIRLLSQQSKQYFDELCTTYPPLFNKMADYIDSRPIFDGSGSAAASYGASSGISSGFSSGTNTDLSGKVEIPSGLVGTADFGHLDPQVSQVIVGTIMRTMELFPNLKLNFVGSAQARNRAMAASLTEEYAAFLRSNYPGYSEEAILNAARKQADAVMQNYKVGSNTLALARVGPTSDDPFFGITFNEAFAWDAGRLNNVVAADVQSGYSAQGCYGAKAVMDHELGHIIDQMVGASSDPVIQDLFAQFSAKDDSAQRKGLSGYANTNIAEFIAEGWAEYQNNPACRETAQKIGSRIMELYDETNGNPGTPPRRVLVKTR